jgi:hypothetical protein
LQEVGGYNALEAGVALLPLTVMMFLLSSRFGGLADRFGPRAFMGAGPIVAGAGLLMLSRGDDDLSYWSEVLPGVAVFGLGLAITVAPLTATVLADVEQEHAGVASGVNNAVARVAGLLAIAAIGALVATSFGSRLDEELSSSAIDTNSPAAQDARKSPLSTDVPASVPPDQRSAFEASVVDASVRGFRVGAGISGLLVMIGGVVSAVGIRNPRRAVEAHDCPGGAICGASEALANVEAGDGRRASPAHA